jgi:hypothetical protein
MTRGLPFCRALFVAAAACASPPADTPPACNQNPWECPTGQNCWPESTSTFACVTAGSGAPGSPCPNVVGTASCVAGFGCYQQSSASMGVCVAYCDSQHPCASGTCTAATLSCDGSSSPCPSIDECVP